MAAAEREEMDAWVLETAARAVAYATSLLHNRTQAEDVVQDCYCRLIQKADDYDLPRDGTKLLFRSITNACINQTTRRRAIASLEALGNEGARFEVADPAAATAERIMMNHELERAVAEGLARLPDMHRAALELKCVGHTQHEIAGMLEITPTYAGVLIHRARQALAEHLAPVLGEATS